MKKVIDRWFGTRRPRGAWFLALGVFLVMVVGGAAGSVIAMSGTSAAEPPSAQPEVEVDVRPVLGLGLDTLFIGDSNASSVPPLDRLSRILAVDPTTGQVVKQFWTRYRPDAALSPDGSHLYVVDSYMTRVLRGEFTDALTAIETQTGTTAWETVLPGDPRQFSLGAPFQRQVWPSQDGQVVYVLMTQSIPVRVVAVDTNTHEVLNEFSFGLICQRIWSLPWSESAAAVCGDSVKLLDMSSGEVGESLALPGFGDAPAVLGGDVAEGARRLYIATSRQQILSVDLSGSLQAETSSFTVPAGWRLANFDPITVSSDGRRMYIGVRSATNLDRPHLAEEVWSYDTTTWERLGTVRISGAGPTPSGDDGAVSMSLSRDGSQLYTLNRGTLTLSIIDTATMTEVQVISGLGQPVYFEPAPDWIISP